MQSWIRVAEVHTDWYATIELFDSCHSIATWFYDLEGYVTEVRVL